MISSGSLDGLAGLAGPVGSIGKVGGKTTAALTWTVPSRAGAAFIDGSSSVAAGTGSTSETVRNPQDVSAAGSLPEFSTVLAREYAAQAESADGFAGENATRSMKAAFSSADAAGGRASVPGTKDLDAGTGGAKGASGTDRAQIADGYFSGSVRAKQAPVSAAENAPGSSINPMEKAPSIVVPETKSDSRSNGRTVHRQHATDEKAAKQYASGADASTGAGLHSIGMMIEESRLNPPVAAGSSISIPASIPTPTPDVQRSTLEIYPGRRRSAGADSEGLGVRLESDAGASSAAGSGNEGHLAAKLSADAKQFPESAGSAAAVKRNGTGSGETASSFRAIAMSSAIRGTDGTTGVISPDEVSSRRVSVQDGTNLRSDGETVRGDVAGRFAYQKTSTAAEPATISGAGVDESPHAVDVDRAGGLVQMLAGVMTARGEVQGKSSLDTTPKIDLNDRSNHASGPLPIAIENSTSPAVLGLTGNTDVIGSAAIGTAGLGSAGSDFAGLPGKLLRAGEVVERGDTNAGMHGQVNVLKGNTAIDSVSLAGPRHAIAAMDTPGAGSVAAAIDSAVPVSQQHGAARSMSSDDSSQTNAAETARNPFQQIDGAAMAHGAGAAGWRANGSGNSLQVGYNDPSLGYVELHARMASSGVHAWLVTQSAASGATLQEHLGSLPGWLEERRTPVESVTVLAQNGGHGSPRDGDGYGGGYGSAGSAGQDSEAGSQDKPYGVVAPVKQETTGWAGRISVMA